MRKPSQVQIVLDYEDIWDILNNHLSERNEESPTRQEIDDVMEFAAKRQGHMTFFEMKCTLSDIRTNHPDND